MCVYVLLCVCVCGCVGGQHGQDADWLKLLKENRTLDICDILNILYFKVAGVASQHGTPRIPGGILLTGQEKLFT